MLDANGLAKDGVRTPWVDVPIARTSGLAPDESPMSFMFGSGEPFDTDDPARPLSGRFGRYLERFTEALDRAVDSGFIRGGGPLGKSSSLPLLASQAVESRQVPVSTLRVWPPASRNACMRWAAAGPASVSRNSWSSTRRPGAWVADRGVDGALGRGDDVERE